MSEEIIWAGTTHTSAWDDPIVSLAGLQARQSHDIVLEETLRNLKGWSVDQEK
jgi:hypothetical protein